MGKRGTYHGTSPTDKSINAMDKFIQKSDRIQRLKDQSNNSISAGDLQRNELKSQLDYYANRTSADIFNERYPSYSYWIDAVQLKSGVYPVTFYEWIVKHRTMLQEMFDNKTSVHDTVSHLKKLGIY